MLEFFEFLGCLSSQIWETFGYYFFKETLCPFLSFSYPSENPLMCILVPLRMYHKSLRLSLVFFISFLICSSDSIISNELPSCLLACLLGQGSSQPPLLNFLVQLLYFSVPEFFLLKKWFLSFCLILFIHHFPNLVVFCFLLVHRVSL